MAGGWEDNPDAGILYPFYGFRQGRLLMPLSIYVNHAFVDGSHLSLFFQKIEQHLKEIAEDGKTFVFFRTFASADLCREQIRGL